MKKYESGEELAKDMKIDPKILEKTFKKYNLLEKKDSRLNFLIIIISIIIISINIT